MSSNISMLQITPTDMDENLVEDILKHNAGVCEDEELL